MITIRFTATEIKTKILISNHYLKMERNKECIYSGNNSLFTTCQECGVELVDVHLFHYTCYIFTICKANDTQSICTFVPNIDLRSRFSSMSICHATTNCADVDVVDALTF